MRPHSPALPTLSGPLGPFFKTVTPKVSGGTFIDGASPGSPGGGGHLLQFKISGWLLRVSEKGNAVAAAPATIVKWAKRPTKYGDRTRAPAEERYSVPYERTLLGARRMGLAAAALVSKSGSSGDASGAHPNWAAIAVSLGKPNPRSLLVEGGCSPAKSGGRCLR